MLQYFVKLAGYNSLLILDKLLPPAVGLFLAFGEFSQWQIPYLIVTNIRYIPRKGITHNPLSRLWNFNERPCIVPHEIHHGLNVVTRALSPKLKSG